MNIEPTIPQPRLPSYVVLDIESAHLNNAGHRRYQQIERYDPRSNPLPVDEADRQKWRRDPRCQPRWPFLEIVAASILVLTPHADGNLEVSTFETFSRADLDERGIIAGIFDKLSDAPLGAKIVTWGGTGHDLPLLVFGAMRYGLTLPADWRWLAQGARNHRHQDLVWTLTGALQISFVHMAEVCAALDIPAKLLAAPNAVARHIYRRDWPIVESIVELDVVSTALLLARWTHLVDGRADLGTVEDRLLREVIASRPQRRYAPMLKARRDRRFAAQVEQAANDARVYAPWIDLDAA